MVGCLSFLAHWQELEKHGLYLQPMKSDQVLAVLRGVKPPTTTASSTFQFRVSPVVTSGWGVGQAASVRVPSGSLCEASGTASFSLCVVLSGPIFSRTTTVVLRSYCTVGVIRVVQDRHSRRACRGACCRGVAELLRGAHRQ